MKYILPLKSHTQRNQMVYEISISIPSAIDILDWKLVEQMSFFYALASPLDGVGFMRKFGIET